VVLRDLLHLGRWESGEAGPAEIGVGATVRDLFALVVDDGDAIRFIREKVAF
jgi:hypothetical protein